MAAWKYMIPVLPNPLTPEGKQKIEAGEYEYEAAVATVMDLTDPERQPAPRAYPYKLIFEEMPYLYIAKSGDRSWRYDFRINNGKSRRTAEIGHYPETDLREARRKLRLQRRALAQGKTLAPHINRHSMNGYHLMFLGA